ncbi:MAG: metallophosphoesterase, partial [Verrucomicrobiales bacterium]
MNEQKYDIIGDIHGRWDKLQPLLAQLGYEKGAKSYQHPEGRQVIFLGDLIDPKSSGVPNGTREVMSVVKAMVENKQAQCILGNH